jgi:hypothetical protein
MLAANTDQKASLGGESLEIGTRQSCLSYVYMRVILQRGYIRTAKVRFVSEEVLKMNG